MSPGDALSAFLQETARFLAAQNFLLRSILAAVKGHKDLSADLKRFEDQVQPTYKDPYTYVSSRLFIAYVSSFEIFLLDIVGAVVRKHPRKLGAIQFRLADVLDAPGIDSLVDRAIEEHLNGLMYKRPMEYLSEICDLLSIPSDPLKPLWPSFVEAKARRDLGVHANWRCNAIYLRKVEEAGLKPDLKAGDSAVPDTEKYLGSVADSLVDLGAYAK